MSIGQTVISVLLALLALAIPTAAYFQASRASRVQAKAEAIKAAVEEKGVDAQAYDRAARLWEEMVTSLRAQVDRLEKSNRQLSDEVASLRGINRNLVMEVSALRAEVHSIRS